MFGVFALVRVLERFSHQFQFTRYKKKCVRSVLFDYLRCILLSGRGVGAGQAERSQALNGLISLSLPFQLKYVIQRS